MLVSEEWSASYSHCCSYSGQPLAVHTCHCPRLRSTKHHALPRMPGTTFVHPHKARAMPSSRCTPFTGPALRRPQLLGPDEPAQAAQQGSRSQRPHMGLSQSFPKLVLFTPNNVHLHICALVLRHACMLGKPPRVGGRGYKLQHVSSCGLHAGCHCRRFAVLAACRGMRSKRAWPHHDKECTVRWPWQRAASWQRQNTLLTSWQAVAGPSPRASHSELCSQPAGSGHLGSLRPWERSQIPRWAGC